MHVDANSIEKPGLLQRATASHRFLADFAFQGTELVYCDPPYLHATRKSARRYRYDYGEADHVALLELLGALPVR